MGNDFSVSQPPANGTRGWVKYNGVNDNAPPAKRVEAQSEELIFGADAVKTKEEKAKAEPKVMYSFRTPEKSWYFRDESEPKAPIGDGKEDFVSLSATFKWDVDFSGEVKDKSTSTHTHKTVGDKLKDQQAIDKQQSETDKLIVKLSDGSRVSLFNTKAIEADKAAQKSSGEKELSYSIQNGAAPKAEVAKSEITDKKPAEAPQAKEMTSEIPTYSVQAKLVEWETLSKKTGISVENLKAWNSDKEFKENFIQGPYVKSGAQVKLAPPPAPPAPAPEANTYTVKDRLVTWEAISKKTGLSVEDLKAKYMNDDFKKANMQGPYVKGGTVLEY